MPRRAEDGAVVPALSPTQTAEAQVWLISQLGAPWTMLEGWLVFGEETGSRFDLLINPDGSSELSVRIDARSNPLPFIESICELGSLLNCVLFSFEQWRQVEPVLDSLASALENSRAKAFVRDPIRALRGNESGA